MKKTMPYDFLLDYLPRNVIILPAIGMFNVYLDKKIVLIFRKTGKNPQHNGIWISTKREFHASLKAEIPAITDFVFNEGEVYDSAWLLLSDTHDDFESAAELVCELVSKRDARIGKVTPKSASISERNL
ncbi:hypothetical protein IDJ77_08530 [Mucilaginibacter sp. ZT4R22]|uniref:YjbR protein n=1 Tax=Mucilaginibacter pankratovii TaxID=2772110 RepID=A0ABR7WNG9_9SPHI|nr:hypothetical protein [Mucilaginibacter pankratovii]MBD1363855.1 hypothetical protein [Mucilaginibacter pankratovii]